MALEDGVMPNGEGVLPQYEGKSTEKLWEEYSGYHEVDPKKKVNKPQEREKKVRHHRKPLTQIIDETLGKDSEGKQRESLDHVESEAQKKKHAAAIVTKIAHEHYKTDDTNAKRPNEDRIRQFLQLSGANVTYEDLLKHIMDLPDLRYDQLPEQSPLKRIIDYTSTYKVPEGRKIFPRLTVMENLKLGAYLVNNQTQILEDIEKAFKLFPILKERLTQLGGTLSGGEQQMLAISRALMSRPKLLLLDEPSMGIAPLLVEKIFTRLVELNKSGLTMLLVEQNANLALKIANRAYVLETGKVALTGKASELLNDPNIKSAYLGQ